MKRKRIDGTIEYRIDARTVLVMPSECIEWKGDTDKDGYGIIWYRSRPWRVHRLVWVLAHGGIPIATQVRHSCDNPPCCNIDHLLLGTAQQNADDMIARGRLGNRRHNAMKTHCKHGHEFTTENTYRTSTQRVCRACKGWQGFGRGKPRKTCACGFTSNSAGVARHQKKCTAGS